MIAGEYKSPLMALIELHLDWKVYRNTGLYTYYEFKKHSLIFSSLNSWDQNPRHTHRDNEAY